MPVELLTALPGGANVFIDTNVFVYGLDGRSRQCAHFLDRCSREEFTGVTLLEVVNEATHRFMLGDAWENGFIPTPTVRALRKRPEIITHLRDYWRRTEQILRMNLLFVPIDQTLMRLAQAERTANGLLTNDSLILACMKHYGISFLASSDEDFASISGVTLFRPDDLI